MVERPMPKLRLGHTYEIEIFTNMGRVKLYLRTGLYEDGTLGEIFVDVAKFGSDLRGMFSCWAITFSIALQNGVPLERLCHSFESISFEPKGRAVTAIESITQCTSVPNVVCQILKAEFLEAR